MIDDMMFLQLKKKEERGIRGKYIIIAVYPERVSIYTSKFI
jgi:hypothetical protein